MCTINQASGNIEESQKLYFTSDNLAFFEEQNAINHSKRLTDKSITIKTKEDVEAEAATLFNEMVNDGDDQFNED